MRTSLSIGLLACCASMACTKHPGAGAPPATIATGDRVKVIKVVKGDELLVEKDGKQASLRLLGVHAVSAVMDDPTLEDLRKPVLAYLGGLINAQVEVTLGTLPKDVHGRYLALISHNGQEVNEQLVRSGYVLVYTEFPFAKESDYLIAETAAREANKGIWSNATHQKMLRGLRKQWAAARGTQPISDPLLEEGQAP